MGSRGSASTLTYSHKKDLQSGSETSNDIWPRNVSIDKKANRKIGNSGNEHTKILSRSDQTGQNQEYKDKRSSTYRQDVGETKGVKTKVVWTCH